MEELVRRMLALRTRYRGYKLLVLDRSRPEGVARLPLDRVERLESGALLLADGTLIPLHRVVGFEDDRGRVTMLRRGA